MRSFLKYSLLVLSLSCGRVWVESSDATVSSRGETTTTIDEHVDGMGGLLSSFGGAGVGGMLGAGGLVGSGGLTGSGGVIGIGGQTFTDAATNDCSLCHLNCVNKTITDGSEPAFTTCNGCVSNCPVNGLQLLCMCNRGCGYNPTEGTCNSIR